MNKSTAFGQFYLHIYRGFTHFLHAILFFHVSTRTLVTCATKCAMMGKIQEKSIIWTKGNIFGL